MLLRSPLLSAFPHGFTTRAGGVSPPPWDELNLGGLVGDEPERVGENWRRLEGETGLRFARVRQVHGARVVHLRTPGPSFDSAAACGGRYAQDAREMEEADAVISTDSGLAACVSVADCVPILIADPETGAVAAVHAGWRGTLARVAEAGVRALAGSSGATPGRLLAAIGPSIGPCCYEISADLAEQFAAGIGPVISAGAAGPHLDLWEANRRVLLAAGLASDRVEVLGRCTSCAPELFFSHRRDRGRTGRHVAFIAPPRPTGGGPLP
jgi:YfiH family protein